MAGRGRRPGSPKTGGRQIGTQNRATLEAKKALLEAERALGAKLSEAEVKAMSPVDVMTLVMRTALKAGNYQVALTAATNLAPYIHPRLSNINVDATIKKSMADYTNEELEALVKGAVSDPDAIH